MTTKQTMRIMYVRIHFPTKFKATLYLFKDNTADFSKEKRLVISHKIIDCFCVFFFTPSYFV